jgi:hypothetical protein
VKKRKKVFARSAAEIRAVVKGLGACFATDEIMVKGRRVGFAYREPPDRAEDSGWRFQAGDESDAYMDDADNLGLYDVNTIANYDPDIIPLLAASPGSAFARDATGKFVRVEGHPATGELDEQGDYPTVEGVYAMTASWTIDLPPGPFKRRFEQGDLVLWRPRITAWIAIHGNDRGDPIATRVRSIMQESSKKAFDRREHQAHGVHFVSYRLDEGADHSPALYAYAVGHSGHVQIGLYFDEESDAETALAMWRGVRETASVGS